MRHACYDMFVVVAIHELARDSGYVAISFRNIVMPFVVNPATKTKARTHFA